MPLGAFANVLRGEREGSILEAWAATATEVADAIERHGFGQLRYRLLHGHAGSSSVVIAVRV